MKNNIRIILIPGNGGATVEDHWFPWVKNQLIKHGFPVVAQNFPDPVLAREKFWIPFLKNSLRANEKTVLIGHSSGAVASIRYAEKHKIYASVLVAPCYTDLGDQNEKASGYYSRPWEWEKIRKNQQWILQFASRNDPYIPIQQARYISKKLNSTYFEFDHRGHFGDPDHVSKTFPELVKAVIDKTRK